MASAGSGVGFGPQVTPTSTSGQTDEAEAFAAWARSAGVQSPKLRMDSFEGIRGMAARQAVEPGDCLVALPREAVLLSTPGQKCPFPDWVDAGFWKQSTWGVRLALLLLHERRLGDASRVAGYLRQLPRAFDTPLHWSPAELEALQYPHLVKEVEEQGRRWRQLHDGLTASSPRCGVGAEDFTWALECVYSRAFSGPYSGGTIKQKGAVAGVLAVLGAGSVLSGAANVESVLNAGIAAVLFNIIYDVLLSAKVKWHALCPVIDSMNHSSVSQSQVAYDYFRDRFVVDANDPVALNAQAFITYGRQGNDRLLQFYGFVEADNPADAYVILELDAKIEEVLGQPVSAERRQALEELGLSGALQKGAFQRTGLAADTAAAARVALLPADPSRTSAADFQQPASDPQAEALVQRVLAKVLEAELQKLQAAPPANAAAQEAGRSGLIDAFRHEKAAVLAASAADLNKLAAWLQEHGSAEGSGSAR